MNNQPFFTSLLVRLLHSLAVIVNALLAQLPVKPTSNSLSSVSWNG